MPYFDNQELADVISGRRQLAFVGDFGMFVFLPDMTTMTNKDRLHLYSKFMFSSNETFKHTHKGGQKILSLLGMGVAVASIIDYLPMQFKDYINMYANDVIGKREWMEDPMIEYRQIDQVNFDVKTALGDELRREEARLEEMDYLVINTREHKRWYSTLFLGHADVDKRLKTQCEDYMDDSLIHEHRDGLLMQEFQKEQRKAQLEALKQQRSMTAAPHTKSMIDMN